MTCLLDILKVHPEWFPVNRLKQFFHHILPVKLTGMNTARKPSSTTLKIQKPFTRDANYGKPSLTTKMSQ